jgi:hypothetical protein
MVVTVLDRRRGRRRSGLGRAAKDTKGAGLRVRSVATACQHEVVHFEPFITSEIHLHIYSPSLRQAVRCDATVSRGVAGENGDPLRLFSVAEVERRSVFVGSPQLKSKNEG